jgi:EmrB/QacA subfamily drug resistance transporter
VLLAEIMDLTDPFMPERKPEGITPDPKGYKWKALATVALGTLMGTMDASITNISFPVLTTVFQADLTAVMWVALVYILVCTSLMLILGKISDLIGRKKIYAGGMAIFTLGLVACSLAQGIGQLILFRILQSVGAAMSVACGPAIVTEAFPPEERGKGLGLLGVSVSLGFILGPTLGGFLVQWLNWRSIFYIRVPVGLITLFMILVLLKKDHASTGRIELDLKGALSSSMGIFCLVLGMSQINKFGFGSLVVCLLIGLGLASLLVFMFVERRVEEPIVDLSLFKNRVFSSATWSLFLSFVAAPAYILIMPFYLMHGLGLTASAAGLLMAVNAMTTIVVGPISGSLSDRFGPVWFSTIGAAAIAAAFYCVRGFDLETHITAIIPVLVLLGVGIGTFQPPNNSIIMGAVSKEHLGTASALIATQRQVGLSLGMALAGSMFSARRAMHQAELLGQGLGTDYVTRLSIPLAFQDVMLISVFIGLSVVLLCLFSGERKMSTIESGKVEPGTAL